MNLLNRLAEKKEWNSYYEDKLKAGNLSKEKQEDLYKFIINEEYGPVVRSIFMGDTFEPPHKTYVNKLHSSKKRIVYTYSREENYVLKMITYLLKDYDEIFADNLYSFRKNKGVKSAVEKILQMKELSEYYSYKVDISDYFNSVNIDKLIPMMQEVFLTDQPLFLFLKGLLENPYIYEDRQLKKEKKGIMAGTPIATFLANLYLMEMDHWFEDRGKIYARYSDDIIFFSKTEEELSEDIKIIHSFLEKYDLKINEKKEIRTSPGEKWTFLGFSYKDGIIDVSHISLEKIKNKMRRKVKALKRWQRKNKVSGENTAKAFIRHFNRVFFENNKNHELTWTRWYFPVINTTEGLHEIDKYMQDQIRYLATETRTKSRYNLRYDDMKKMGYESLVASYYNGKGTNFAISKQEKN